MKTIKVKLLRDLLVTSNVQADAAGSTVDMDEGRAKELASRNPPLVEFSGSAKLAKAGEVSQPQDNTLSAPDAVTTGDVSTGRTVGTMKAGKKSK